MTKDYYSVLGLSTGASENEIRKAYRKLAMRFHPDVNSDPAANKKFLDISEAYRYLSKAENRMWYEFLEKQKEKTEYRKYGQSKKNAYYSDDQQRNRQSDPFSTRSRPSAPVPKYKKTKLDFVLYAFLILIGVLGIVFGFMDLLFQSWNVRFIYNGLIFGSVFLFVLIAGWKALDK